MDKEISYTSTKISSYIGYFVQAIVNNFLPILFIALQDVYGIGYEKLGRLVMFNFVTQMITDILSPKIIAKTGYPQGGNNVPVYRGGRACGCGVSAENNVGPVCGNCNRDYNLRLCKRAYGGYFKPDD